MPAPESEMTATRLCDLFGIERDSDVWWELKKALAAAYAKGMEEAAKIADEWYENDTTGLECHEYIRSKIPK